MKNQRNFDRYDMEAERESNALNRFRNHIGQSVGQQGTPKSKTRLRSCKKGGSNDAHFSGAKTGVWRGL